MVSRVTTTQRGGDPTASPPDTWADAGFDGVATSPTATANTVPGDAEESKLAAKLPVTPSPTKSSNRFSKWGKIRATIQAKEGFRWSLHMPRTPSRMQRGEKRRMSFSISNQKADPYAQMLLNMAASPQNASGAADVMAGVSETDTLTEDNGVYMQCVLCCYLAVWLTLLSLPLYLIVFLPACLATQWGKLKFNGRRRSWLRWRRMMTRKALSHPATTTSLQRCYTALSESTFPSPASSILRQSGLPYQGSQASPCVG